MFVQPYWCLFEQEEADILATIECGTHRFVETGIHIGEFDGESRNDRQAAFGSIGNARERVDRRYLNREIDAADAREFGGEDEQIWRMYKRRQRPGEVHRERESRWRLIVGIFHLHHLVFETEQCTRIDLE